MAKIYVTRKIPGSGIAQLKAAGHEVVVSDKNGVLSKEELIAALAEAPYDALLCLLTDEIDTTVLDAAPTLKVIANYAVGYNNIDVAASQARGIVVTNTPGVLTDTVAEFTVALLLSLVKRIPEADTFSRAGAFVGWAPELLLGSDLKGKTLGIIGGGRIGASVAKRLYYGFGMRVMYTDIEQCAAFEEHVPSQYIPTIDALLPAADVVSIHVPLSDDTHHLLNATKLALMKPTAYLVNTARGPIIDEVALAAMLEDGRLAGAALDVYEYEPAITTVLTTMHNVVLTPHIASASTETRSRMSVMAAENIVAVLTGQTAPNTIQVD